MSTRRVSLRRKRGPRDERGDSPLSKRVSPSVEDHEITEHYENRIKKNSSQKMAAAIQPPSTPKNNINLDEHTVHFSPDTPLMCSQFMGTQECEVVWDCNSPGFTKEDLKRMCNGDDASPIPIMPPPQRTLFPMALRNRSVSGRSSSSGKSSQASLVAAQLNALLQSIPRKDASPKDVVDGVFSESTTPEMDDSYGVSTSLLEELTQPFQISGVEQVDEEDDSNKRVIINEKTQNESLNDEEEMELNSPKTFAQNVCARSSVPSLSESLAEDMNMSMNMSALDMNMAVTDVSSMSADLFDDDLFNDSVMIRTTQAVEAENFDSRKVFKSTPIAVDKKDNKKLSSASSDEGVGPSQTSTGSNVDLGNSPVLGKFRSPENVPTRKIRNTFRLGNFDSPVHKKEDPLRNALKETNLSNQTSLNNNVINTSNTNTKVCKSISSKGEHFGLEDTETEKSLVNDKRVLSNVKPNAGVNMNRVSRLSENTNTFVSKDSNIVKSNNRMMSEKSAITSVNQHATSQLDKINPTNNQGIKTGSQSISNSSYQQTRLAENTSTFVFKGSNIVKSNNKMMSEKSAITSVNQLSTSQLDKLNPRNNQGIKTGLQSISNSSSQQTRLAENSSTFVFKDSNIVKSNNKMMSEKSAITSVNNQHATSQLDKLNPRNNQGIKTGSQSISNSSYQQTRFKQPQKQSNLLNKNDGNKMPRSKSTNNACINSKSNSSSLRRINSSDTPSPKCALTDRFNSAVNDFQFKEFEDDDDFFASVLEDEFSDTTIDTVSSSIPKKQENSKMSLFSNNLQPTRNYSKNMTSSNIITEPPSVYEKAKQFNSFSGKNSTISNTKDGFQRATMSSGQVLKGDKSSPKKSLQVASHSSSSSTVSRVLLPNSESLTHSDTMDDDDDLFQDDVLTAIEEVEIQYTQSQIQDSQESYTEKKEDSPIRCSQEEISRKKDEAMRRRIERQKEDALRRREERQRQRNQSGK